MHKPIRQLELAGGRAARWRSSCKWSARQAPCCHPCHGASCGSCPPLTLVAAALASCLGVTTSYCTPPSKVHSAAGPAAVLAGDVGRVGFGEACIAGAPADAEAVASVGGVAAAAVANCASVAAAYAMRLALQLPLLMSPLSPQLRLLALLSSPLLTRRSSEHAYSERCTGHGHSSVAVADCPKDRTFASKKCQRCRIVQARQAVQVVVMLLGVESRANFLHPGIVELTGSN